MANMHDQAEQDMKNMKCPHCGSTEKETDHDTLETTCGECGCVIENSFSFTHISTKGPSGELEKTGSITNMRNQSKLNYDHDAPSSLCQNNEEKLKRGIKREINLIISKLEDYPTINIAVDQAVEIWTLCYKRQLTRGYKREELAAIVFYIACRQMDEPLPFLLIDFARILQRNVFKLAKIFYRLCKDVPIKCFILDDPTVFIQRYCRKLGFAEKEDDIIYTAIKLVNQMKEDWISTGRRPSGVYGAAILISGRMHGFNLKIKQIVNVVQLSEGTIKKRISEFIDTNVAMMRVGDFIKTDKNDIIKLNKNGEQPPVIKKYIKSEQMKKLKSELKSKSESIKNDKLNNENEDEDEDEDDDIIDYLMKSEKESVPSFIRAEHRDDDDDNIKTVSEFVQDIGKDYNIKNISIPLGLEDEHDHEVNDENMSINHNNYSFISGAQTRAIDLKQYEDYDLSHLDDDPEVTSMILNDDETKAKEELFDVVHPDYDIVKKRSDRRAKLKEEKDRRSKKRKLNDLYKNEENKIITNRVNKRFRSDKLNEEILNELLGNTKKEENDLLPSLVIKRQDDLADIK